MKQRKPVLDAWGAFSLDKLRERRAALNTELSVLDIWLKHMEAAEAEAGSMRLGIFPAQTQKHHRVNRDGTREAILKVLPKHGFSPLTTNEVLTRLQQDGWEHQSTNPQHVVYQALALMSKRKMIAEVLNENGKRAYTLLKGKKA